MPSSLTTTVSVPGKPWPSTKTLAWLARACLATLVSASATRKYATASTAGFGRTGTSTCTSTGTGHSAASPDRAASRPRSVSTGGCTPRTRFRNSDSAALASACAWSTRTLAASTSSPNFAWARPSSIASATSRCCAPSCRSRSIRRRSASAAPTTRSRLTSSSVTRAARFSGGASSHRANAVSALARPRVTDGAASSSSSPAMAEATRSAGPVSTVPSIVGPPPGSSPPYSGSVSRTTPIVHTIRDSTAVTRLTGSRRSA